MKQIRFWKNPISILLWLGLSACGQNFVVGAQALNASTAAPSAGPTAPATNVPASGTVGSGTLPTFQLLEDFSGAQFFDHFNFINYQDPSNGYVTYEDQATAQRLGLVSVNGSGHAVIGVDSTQVSSGLGRPAVRLSSNSIFTTGLFVIDVDHLPEGLGTWPAFWSFGPNWPNNGEIDVIESVSNSAANSTTLHTKTGCTMNQVNASQTMTGTYGVNRDCHGNSGCTTTGPENSFGPGFNSSGGGVYAMLWTSTQISVWYWPRRLVPTNITSGAVPDLTQWGLPTSYFQLGVNCPANYFSQHNLVVNTTFCGDWAGAVFNGPTGAGNGACVSYVQNNPGAFTNAFWEINFIRAYSVP